MAPSGLYARLCHAFLVCIIFRQQIHQVEFEPHNAQVLITDSCQSVKQCAFNIDQCLLPGDYTPCAISSIFDKAVSCYPSVLADILV